MIDGKFVISFDLELLWGVRGSMELKDYGENEQIDACHYIKSLIKQIKGAGHEIGFHTFSYYYCLEPGKTAKEFNSDLEQIKILYSLKRF